MKAFMSLYSYYLVIIEPEAFTNFLELQLIKLDNDTAIAC